MQQMNARSYPTRRHHRRTTPALDLTMHVDAPDGADAVCRGTHVPLARAIEFGLMSREGYLTPLGFTFWRNAR